MKQLIYIRSWNGFFPSSLVKETNLSNHYKKFYSLPEKKFKEEREWLNLKKSISNDLAKLVNPYKNILSVGCGRGYLEKFISQNLNNKNFIHGIDPYINLDSQLDSDSLKIEKKSVYDSELATYDIAYLNTVDYCLKDAEYKRICKRIKELSLNGIIISQLMPPDLDYLFSLKYRVGTLIKSLPFTPYVFWGWQRTIDEHIEILRSAGYKRYTCGYHKDNIMWIHAI